MVSLTSSVVFLLIVLHGTVALELQYCQYAIQRAECWWGAGEGVAPPPQQKKKGAHVDK